MIPRVLVIHDRIESCDALTDVVGACGCDCRAASDCAAAMREIARYRPDLVWLAGSVNDPASATLFTLKRLTAERNPVPVIATGMPHADDAWRRATARVIRRAIADADWQNKAIDAKAHAA